MEIFVSSDPQRGFPEIVSFAFLRAFASSRDVSSSLEEGLTQSRE
jgi:hypothetical protein